MLRRTLGKWCTKAAAPAAATSEFEKQYKSLGSGLQGGGMKEKTSIAVLIPRQGTGALMKVLQKFKDHDISLDRLTSRPSAWHENNENVTMFIDWGLHMDDPRSKAIFDELRKSQRYVQLLGTWRVPWFASCGEELDLLEQKTMAAGADLQDDPTNPHPGFHDEEYKARRRMISEVAAKYRHGQQLPIIEYTQQEKDTWTAVWDQLTMLFPTHACRTYNRMFQLLVERAGYCRTEIPQLRDVNEFLLDQTGFTVRPVAGLLSTRDFFNALALRIFYSTQYIRHHSKPLYTPEPDLVHELVGHVPLFADPDFADFSQAIGLASLGASDEVIEQLGRVYWYSVEFGLCREAGGVRAYGSGILSSFGELQYALSKEPQLRAWDPFEAAKLPFPITTYQPVYFVAENFKDALVKFREFMTALDPPFQVKFNQAARRVKAFSHNDEE